jgi:hypothetical protein
MKLDIRYKALSPISHNGDEVLSTVSPFRRQKVDYAGNIIDIPVLSGNGFRGNWRRIGAKHLLDNLGIEKVSPDLYHMLFAGGALTGSTEDEQVTYKKEIRRLMPFLSVFGSAMGSFMLSGKLSSGFGYVISEETEQFTGIKSNRTIYEFLSTEFYTRREDYEADRGDEIPEKTVQMKYETEVLIAGTEIMQTVILKSCTDIEIGCFMNILQQWQKEGAIIGGVARAGHGRVDFDIDFSEYQDKIYKYNDYIKENTQEISSFLTGL